MQLAFLKIGEKQTIKTIIGKDDTRSHMEELGFVTGEKVEILSKNGGNLIVLIKNTRIAIDQSIAMRIVV